MSERYVLDASALLCLLQREAGADRVRKVIAGALMSTVNWSEVVAKLADGGVSETDIEIALRAFPINLIPFDREQGRLAGLMRPATRGVGLSLGDRACLALAAKEEAVAVTTEQVWRQLVDRRVEVVR